MPGESDEISPDALAQFRAGIVDERFAVNIREWREFAGMSQSELGRRMAALGWPFHPQTVQRIESGQRKVSVGEAKSLAEILATTVDRLTLPGREASIAAPLEQSVRNVQLVRQHIAGWARSLAYQQRMLARAIAEAEASLYKDSERIAGLLRDAHEALAYTPESVIGDAVNGHAAELLRDAAEAQALAPNSAPSGTQDDSGEQRR